MTPERMAEIRQKLRDEGWDSKICEVVEECLNAMPVGREYCPPSGPCTHIELMAIGDESFWVVTGALVQVAD